MEFLDPHIAEYISKYTQEESSILKKLNRETWAKILNPQMISGHVQGRVLSMLSRMIRPNYILEIGTFTGYSAICLAEGLQKGGELYTIDQNEELKSMVTSYFQDAGISSFSKHLVGNALEIIPTLKQTFDLVYIDADKENYGKYYDLVFDKVRKSGYIIADNILWSGKVLEDPQKWDAQTKALVEYSQKIHNDSRVVNVILPVRDGLMIAQKK